VIRGRTTTEYGLVAYLYTKDLSRGMRVSEKLDYGMIGLTAGWCPIRPRRSAAPSKAASAGRAPMRHDGVSRNTIRIDELVIR